MRIEAQEITVAVGTRRLLDRVNFAVEEGQLLGLIGPNGAGKTTLMKVLARLRKPDDGRVRLDGHDAASFGRLAHARCVAYLPQGSAIAWPVTVERLVELGRLPHRGAWRGLTPRDRGAIERALQATMSTALVGRVVASLSGGERMRILLARALAVEAEVLLADEPVATLDPHHQLQVMELLRAQARGGGAVVAVLHDLTLASRFCDRLILLHEGRVAATGGPDSVLAERNLREVYRITALRGSADGEGYVVPWERSSDSNLERKGEAA